MARPAKDPAKPTLQVWPIERPVPYAHNARIIPDSAVGKVAASIREFGFRQPIVVDREGVIIAGHTRILAAKQLGLKEVPVLVAADLTPAQVRAYRLADNRTAQETTWDLLLLNSELEDLAGLDIDLILTGFDPGELAGLPLYGTGATDPAAEWDAMPEFEQEDANAAFRVTVNFATEEDLADFFKTINRPRRRSMWWPEGGGLEQGALAKQFVDGAQPA